MFQDLLQPKELILSIHSSILQIFKKHEILDSVPFSYYRALKRKKTDLIKLGLFENEKKRLNKMGEKNILPGREKYKIQIIDLINSEKSKRKKKTIRGN
ncbi:MAG: hypothetical protein OEW78_04175 [Nitrosopumilus sp.]|uniref:hypothetical protein n=1 Tax=Nitrosopumilus sp. TaxID=2024843 RepID=UPI00246D44D5|nr:hypothetical protein [Nitrosopumilus sp.]MDH5431062.1 hypothetical protein [Nitrosopumilus sp.]